MRLETLLQQYARRYKRHGSFCLARNEDLRACIAQNDVPNLPAAYLIYGLKRKARELLYIGKSGTVRTDGSFKNQGLAVRLRMKQTKTLWRAQYYADQMAQRKLDALEFEWYITFDGPAKVLPFKAEADLLQAYFDDNGRLSPWNLAA